MWNLRNSSAVLTLVALATLGACDFGNDGAGITPPDEGEAPRYAALDSTFASDTSRTFVQLERLANPLAMEVFVAKREHGAHDVLPPFRDPGLFTDDYVDFITGVAGRPTFLAQTVASVLLGQIGTNEGDKLTVYTNRAPGVTAATAAQSNLVGWLTYVLAPGQGWGGRKLANDDVVDKGAGIVFGTVVTNQGTVSPGLVTDNVNSNDAVPLNTFPYFPLPHAGPAPTPPPASLTAFTVRIENVSNANTLITAQGGKPVPLSPGAFAVFRGQNPLFVPGTAADEGTERIAEDGFPQAKVQMVAGRVNRGADTVRFFGTFNAPQGTPAIQPGQAAEFGIQAARGDRFSFQTMFVESNDLFYAFGGNGVPLFDANGNPFSGDVTMQVVLWDAGTEVDQPLGVGDAQKPRQPHLNFGASEGDVIRTAAVGAPFGNTPAVAQVIRVTIRPGAPQ